MSATRAGADAGRGTPTPERRGNRVITPGSLGWWGNAQRWDERGRCWYPVGAWTCFDTHEQAVAWLNAPEGGMNAL